VSISSFRLTCSFRVQQGHLLWNAGRTLATYLENNADSLIRGKSVLELGAGAGLPSLVSAIHGARHVVVTDYPDPDLVENLQWNVDHCAMLPQPRNIEAKGYLWGAETETLVSGLSSGEANFDLLILADLLFNHSEHRKLVSSVQQMLKRSADAQALVFFTPYRPWLFQNDLAFFDLAKEAGFVVEKFFEHTMEKVMFEEDPGVSTLPKLSTDDVRVRDADCTNRMSSFDGQFSDTALIGLKTNYPKYDTVQEFGLNEDPWVVFKVPCRNPPVTRRRVFISSQKHLARQPPRRPDSQRLVRRSRATPERCCLVMPGICPG